MDFHFLFIFSVWILGGERPFHKVIPSSDSSSATIVVHCGIWYVLASEASGIRAEPSICCLLGAPTPLREARPSFRGLEFSEGTLGSGNQAVDLH